MHSKVTTQGQMWDLMAFQDYENEFVMRDIVDINQDFADALILQSELKINMPEVEDLSIQPNESLPPWEL